MNEGGREGMKEEIKNEGKEGDKRKADEKNKER